MLYVDEGHKKDMYFVCRDTEDGEFEIVRVFYSEIKAKAYKAMLDAAKGDYDV